MDLRARFVTLGSVPLTAMLSLALLLPTAALAAGCSSPDGAPATQPAPPAAASTSQSGGPPQGQTLWRLLDERGNVAAQLPDDDPDVVAIRSLLVRHSDVVDHRAASNIAASIQGEFTAYTQEFGQHLRAQDYAAAVESMYADNGLAVALKELSWYGSTISSGRRTATFETASTFTFTAGAPAFLKARGLTLNQPYVERRRVGLTRTEHGWLISSIDRLPLERA